MTTEQMLEEISRISKFNVTKLKGGQVKHKGKIYKHPLVLMNFLNKELTMARLKKDKIETV